MGNTLARYLALDAAKLRAFLAAHPPDDDDQGDDVDADERAEALLEELASTAAVDRAEAWDVVHDLTGDLAPRLADLEDQGTRSVWTRFLTLLGHPDPTPDLPWWLAPLAEAHWVALTPPREVQTIASDFTLYRPRIVEAARESGAHERLDSVAGFVERCGARGTWLFAIESMG